jgi:hypothetical protein
MSTRLLGATGVAVALAVAMGCSQSGSPVSPTVSPAGAGAAADGSTLKATAPNLDSPRGGVRLDTLEPEFVFGPAQGLYTDATFTYRIQVQRTNGQTVAEAANLTPGGDGRNRWEVPFLLDLDTAYRWRARAELGGAFGPWSSYGEFLSLDYRGLVPRPPNGAWPTTGEDVVDYIAEVFPEYLVPTALTAQRIANMEFLRDRIIEAGVCGGLDVGRNLKRGIGPHSTDAIAWRKANGFVEVVDIASAFDDKTIPLILHWSIVEGPPGFDPLPDHPGC